MGISDRSMGISEASVTAGLSPSMHMQGMSGLELVQAFYQGHQSLAMPIVLMGSLTEPAVCAAVKAGMCDLIQWCGAANLGPARLLPLSACMNMSVQKPLLTDWLTFHASAGRVRRWSCYGDCAPKLLPVRPCAGRCGLGAPSLRLCRMT
jgi:hypothetical protein